MTSQLLSDLDGYFANIEDPRQHRKIEHPLINILFITLCGVLCGADDWVAITQFARSQKEWLSNYLDLKNGIPSHDTLGRLFSLIDREQFQQGFMNWMSHVSHMVEGVVAIDGKQLRRSHDKGVGKSAIHMVTAWSVANGIVLAQRKVDEKSNEITAIPPLLEALDLTRCIVTIDAMGCQTEIAQKIIDQGGDYVLSLKGNQGTLHEDVADLFTYFAREQFKGITHDYHKTVSKAHGRLEVRECWVYEIDSWADYVRNRHKWAGLRCGVMVRAQRDDGKKVTTETRYFITSLGAQAAKLLQAIRSHWCIENELHWVLDIAFNEDQSRIREGYGAENMAVIRHFVLNLLAQDKSNKVGKKTKRLRCGWDIAYREKVLANLSSLC